MQQRNPSIRIASRRGPAQLAAVALALAMAGLGAAAVVAAGTASAFSAVETQAYTISGAASVVSGVTATVSPNTAAATGNYTLKLTTPSALTVSTTKTSASYVDVAVANSALAVGNAVVSSVSAAGVGVVDLSTGYTFTATIGDGFLTPGTAEAMLSTAESLPMVVYLGGSGTVRAGDTLTLTFSASNPGTAGLYNFYMNTSVNGSWEENASGVTIVGATTPTVSANTYSLGTGATYTMSNVTVAATISVGTATINLQACKNTGTPPVAACVIIATTSGTGAVTFSTIASSYTVIDTNTSAALTVTQATAITGSNSSLGGVALTVTVPVAVSAGSELTITATGVNPSSAESDYFVASFAGSTVPAGPMTFGGSVSGVTVAVSNTTATGTASYTVGFTVSPVGAMSGANTITLQGPGGTEFANPTGAVVTDSTSGATEVVSAIAPSTTTTTDDTLALPITLTIADSDAVSVSVFSVTNPAAGTYSGTSGFSVKTSADPTAAYAAAYVIGPVVVSSGSPSVVVTPNSAGSLATYTVGPFKSASALIGGTDTLEVVGPTGTEFPGTATLSDATSSSGSQTLTLKSGSGTSDVKYGIVTTVNVGDTLTLTLAGTVNPAGGTYNLYLGADTEAANTTASGTEGLAAPAAPPTTTTVPTTTPHPAVTVLTTTATVANGLTQLQLRCSVATCRGTITLTDVTTVIVTRAYSLGAGKTATFPTQLNSKGVQFLAGAKQHSITVTEKVTVTGGTTMSKRVTLTSTTKTPPRPTVSALTTTAIVSKDLTQLQLRCSGATCRGQITLVDVSTVVAAESYSLAAGKTATFPTQLNSKGVQLLAHAAHHAITVTETVTVSGGTTVTKRITLVG